MPQPNPRAFPPHLLVKLLNSSPLGAVLTVAKLRKHREQAGFAISSDGETVDFLKYCAWLCFKRHSRPAARSSGEAAPGSFAAFVEAEQAAVAEILKGVPRP